MFILLKIFQIITYSLQTIQLMVDDKCLFVTLTLWFRIADNTCETPKR